MKIEGISSNFPHQNQSTGKENRIRILLIIIHLIVGLNAIAGGYYGITGAPEVPLAWLEGSPFTNYFIPSLVLFIVIGGSQLLSGSLFLLKIPSAEKLSILAGLILFFWITIQVAIIGYVSWLQPAMIIAAITTIVLSRMRSAVRAPRDSQ